MEWVAEAGGSGSLLCFFPRGGAGLGLDAGCEAAASCCRSLDVEAGGVGLVGDGRMVGSTVREDFNFGFGRGFASGWDENEGGITISSSSSSSCRCAIDCGITSSRS